jgi:hypothetical protein
MHNSKIELDIGCMYQKGKIFANFAIESELHARRGVIHEGLVNLA